MSEQVKTAVIPVAGKGTRFLPATKAMPKELIPILNKPMIYSIVEEAVESGIDQIVFITARGKTSLEDFFDNSVELETFLEGKSSKAALLEEVRKISSMVEIVSVRQKQQLGLGHALLQAENVLGGRPFAVLLGDDMVVGKPAATKQLIDLYDDKHASVLGVMNVAPEQSRLYGMIEGIKECEKLWKVSGMVEKPEPEDSPSTLAVPGRYIFTPEIFEHLKTISRGAGGEYQLTDAIKQLAQTSAVYAYEFDGVRYDTGSLEGYFQATVDFALADPKLGEFARSYLRSKIN